MTPPPKLLLSRLATALRASRRVRPIVATLTTDAGHYAAWVRDRRLYVARTETGPMLPTHLLAAIVVPVSDLPLPVAVDLADAIREHEERSAPAFVVAQVGEA